jgi:DNA-binding response OmpR family regulator
MKILVIEDEKKMALFIKRGLEEERYIVETAFDGQTGLEMALHNQYDAIVLDVMLPKSNARGRQCDTGTHAHGSWKHRRQSCRIGSWSG